MLDELVPGVRVDIRPGFLLLVGELVVADAAVEKSVVSDTALGGTRNPSFTASSNPHGVGRHASGGRNHWRSLRESNPCFRRERATSWAARRRELGRWPPFYSHRRFALQGEPGQKQSAPWIAKCPACRFLAQAACPRLAAPGREGGAARVSSAGIAALSHGMSLAKTADCVASPAGSAGGPSPGRYCAGPGIRDVGCRWRSQTRKAENKE